MALKFKLDQSGHDALSETMRSAYIETDPGSYVLDIDNPETSGLKNALARTREERNTLRGHLSAVREIDAYPTTVRQKYTEMLARAETTPEPMDEAKCAATLAEMKPRTSGLSPSMKQSIAKPWTRVRKKCPNSSARIFSSPRCKPLAWTRRRFLLLHLLAHVCGLTATRWPMTCACP